MKLAGGQRFDYSLLENFGVLVRPELLAQLELAVGDVIRIGTERFTIRGVIEVEPGRRLGAFSLGPRVFISYADLGKTGLLSFGSRASFQRLVKSPDAGLDAFVAGLRQDFTNTFARVRSYKATEDDIGEDFTRAENYLSLVGLVIVILGGIGVSSVTRVFVQQKIRSIAILKCVGGRSRSAADDLHGPGHHVGPGGQRVRRRCWRRSPSPPFRRRWPPPRRRASSSTTR